ncbi:MAG TPA: cyclase family protein [Microvirga sp.]|jgi:kynurenine formamidase|nr:cyclase family protein [Microvirga sp.]
MNRLLLKLAATALIAAAPAAAQQAAAPSPWVVDPATLSSRFGSDDQRGNANLLSPEVVKRALTLVREGRVISLAVPLSRDTPAYGWRRFEVIVAQNEGTGHSNNEDIVTAPINTGTQIDGLAHMGVDGHFFGGRKGADIQAVSGLKKDGIENAPPIVTRGVLLDIAGLKGTERLPIGYVVTPADIEAAMKRQGIAAIDAGDVVIFHTGHRTLLRNGDTKTFLSGQPGPGIAAAEWLAGRQVVAVGGDSGSMEAMPHERTGLLFPVHQLLLAKHGIYILENIATERLAEAGWSEFLFVAAPLPMVGASSSWINPVAIR